jgi:hypothetical protein
VLERLGAGATATVFSAYDAQLERIVALKVLRAQLQTSDIGVRLLREAQAMARLRHPNVVTVYDVGTFDDRIYIAMEFVDGMTLRKWVKREPRRWREVLEVLKSAGRGLAWRTTQGSCTAISSQTTCSWAAMDACSSRTSVLPAATNPVQLRPASAEAGACETGSRTREKASWNELRPKRALAGATAEATSTIEPSTPRSWSSSSSEPLTEEGAVWVRQVISRRSTSSRASMMPAAIIQLRRHDVRDALRRASLPLQELDDVLRCRAEAASGTANIRRSGRVHAVIERGLAQNPEQRFATIADLLAELERDPWKRRRRWAIGCTRDRRNRCGRGLRQAPQRAAREEPRGQQRSWRPPGTLPRRRSFADRSSAPSVVLTSDAPSLGS